MVKLEDGKTKKGMRQMEGIRWRGDGGGQVEGKASQVETKQVEGIQVGVKQVEGIQVEERGEEVGASRVVEAKLRGRILVKPREQMWMLQKVKVNVYCNTNDI